MNLGFDVFAMSHPKTRDDMEALAREALYELEEINKHIDKAIKCCEERKQ